MRFSLKKISIAVIYLLLVFVTNAQPGCPEVNVVNGNNQSLPCGATCITLKARPFQVGNTSTYTVSQIPYAPPFAFNSGTQVPNTADDFWSAPIELPFTFCFFGNSYNSILVQSNGAVSFDTAYTPGGSLNPASPNDSASWAVNGPFPANSPDDLHNSIMSPYQDLDNTNQGYIYYQLGGTAPCRYFTASWYDCAMFGDSASSAPGYCNEDDHQTQMIVIYETTNVIEIYIQKKDPICSDGADEIFNGGEPWNDGLAVEGIENATGTTFIGVPGRNGTQWSATNDAWRFTPAGTSLVTTSWWNGGNQISTDSVVQVCPSAATTYTAMAVYTPCGGGTPITVTDNVTVSLSGALNAGIDSFKNVSCFGAADGQIYAHATTANPPVAYGWSNGSAALTLTNLAPGKYIFTASDAAGCDISDTVIITQPAALTVSVPNVHATTCTGTGTGALVSMPAGGTAPYTYLWNNGEAGIADTAITPGTYTVLVTDSAACTATASGNFVITVGTDNIALGTPIIQNVDCFGNSNGSIVAIATGGVAPYSYAWSNGGTTAAITNLPNNPYTVMATDAGGCTATATYTVQQPDVLAINAPVLQNIGCSTTITGSIIAQVSGGTPQYTYTWTNVSNSSTLTGDTISGLQPGTYTLTVTDVNHCSTAATYQITRFTPLVITADSVNVSCYGGSNGSAAAVIVSGTPPYSYSWDQDPGSSDSTIFNLSQGPVDVFVTDSNNCTADRVIYITQPQLLTIQLLNIKNVSCTDSADGTITVTGVGGTPPFVYNWSTNVTGATDTALIIGTYAVTATDANSCTASATFSISQPLPLLIGPAVIQNIGCSGGNSGIITGSALQGTPGYTYKWTEQSNGQTFTGQTINNLAVDTYSVTITDANGCHVDTSGYAITAIPLVSFTASSTPVSCFGGNNGSVLVSVTSGTAPFQYSFDNGANQTDSATGNVTAGPFLINVTDANGCQADSTIIISQPAQPIVITEVSPQVNEICNGGNNGEIAVSASGGTPGYTFKWSNQFLGTDNANLTAGPYTLIVIDFNDCADTAYYNITQPTPVVATPIATNAICHGTASGSIDANPSGGTPEYSFIWNNGQTTQIADTLAKGLYDCTVTDANGCSVVFADSVGEPAKIVLTRDSGIAVLCFGQKNGKLLVTATGGTPPYFYNATKDGVDFNSAENGVISGLDTGNYVIQIFDSVGCSVIIPEGYVPPAIPDEFYPPVIDSTLCYGSDYNDGGAFVLDSTTQNGPYQYSIDGGALQDSGYFQNLSAGPHTITAINRNGCTSTIPVVVPQPLPIEVIVTPDSVTIPLGGGQSVLVTSLNTTNPSYNWSPSLGLSCADCPNPVVNSYTAGNYVVTVSMVNGVATCYGTANLVVNVLGHTRAYVPNAFSPNGDGNNDLFMVYGEDIKTLDMKVFNRWGELVYSSTNSVAGWDGSYKGQMQLPGVFTYIVTITYLDNSQETEKGTVTLLR